MCIVLGGEPVARAQREQCQAGGCVACGTNEGESEAVASGAAHSLMRRSDAAV